MTDELFNKIIYDLAEMNYSGVVSLYASNEPFLDERIINFYKTASEKLSSASLALYTNGTLLTLDAFLEILNYTDLLVINNYNDEKVINTEELRRIHEYITSHSELRYRVFFRFRLLNEILTSRGGQTPNKKIAGRNNVIDELCILPYTQLVIRPTGKVSLCCNDVFGKYTMGDLNVQTVNEVWNSDEYHAVRTEMLRNHRRNLRLCRDCDTMHELPGVKRIR